MGKDRDWERFGVSDLNNLPVQEQDLSGLIAQAEQAEAFLPQNQREVLRSVHDGMAAHLAACIQAGDTRPISQIRDEAIVLAGGQSKAYNAALQEYQQMLGIVSSNQNGKIQ